MKTKYDPQVDAAYISFGKDDVQVTTIRLTKDIAVDFGPYEEIIGIEILDASKYLNLRKESSMIELKNSIYGV